MAWRRAWAGWIAIATAIVASPARTEPLACEPRDAPAIFSEARAARWLVGEDVATQASLDAHRAYVSSLHASHGAPPKTWEAFAATTLGLQMVGGVPACSSRGVETASLVRYRLSLTSGVTHVGTGLSVRVSALGAVDSLGVDVRDPSARGRTKSSSDESSTGYLQGLVALRLGHARWGRLVLGHVVPEATFVQPAHGVTLAPRLPTTDAATSFYGVDIPALHTSILTVSRDGTPEIIQLVARDLAVPGSPTAVSLGPTYIREERQTIGFLRVRGNMLGAIDARRTRRAVAEADAEPIAGERSTGAFVGPSAEVSAEAGDARLRHARVRLEAIGDDAMVSDDRAYRSYFRGGVYLESTVFRSRFFEASRPKSPRPAAFGAGGGVSCEIAIAPVAFVVDAHAAFNRPELLSLLPSAAGLPEARFSLAFRLEN